MVIGRVTMPIIDGQPIIQGYDISCSSVISEHLCTLTVTVPKMPPHWGTAPAARHDRHDPSPHQFPVTRPPSPHYLYLYAYLAAGGLRCMTGHREATAATTRCSVLHWRRSGKYGGNQRPVAHAARLLSADPCKYTTIWRVTTFWQLSPYIPQLRCNIERGINRATHDMTSWHELTRTWPGSQPNGG